MNSWNIETQLRKWAPQQPSPELRSSIFTRDPVETPSTALTFREMTRWFVPAFGCFLLMMAVLSGNYQHSNFTQLAATNWLAPLDSNPGASTQLYAPAPGHSGVNSVPRAQVEYSFGAKSIRPALSQFLISYTNRLIQ